MGKKQSRWIILFVLLVLAGTIRIAVAHYLPNDAPDDGRVYAQIARNVLERHVYSHETEPPYSPSLIRLPGYPLFLAAIYSVFGHGNNGAVRIVQALIDTATCALVALLAFFWQPDERRKFATAIAAFILAALCPFTMIYSATILTEVPTMFLAAAMCLAATLAFRVGESSELTTETRKPPRSLSQRSIVWWSLAGLLGGLAVLLRPDSGLFAAAVGVTLVVANIWSAVASEARHRFGLTIEGVDPKRRRRFALPAHSIKKTFLAGATFSLAFGLVLVPWTIRNERVFHLFQPLAPAHGEMPGEFVPRGYSKWLRTWLDDEKYIGPFLWQLDTNRIDVDDIPPRAFDSKDEEQRVATLLEKYNHPPDTESGDSEAQPSAVASPQRPSAAQKGNEDSQNNDAGKGDAGGDGDEEDTESDETPEPESVEMTADIDAGFDQLARERIARHPVRYYVWLPVKRAGTMWLNTHSQYWPWDGELLPLADLDHDIHQQYWLPLFAGLTFVYTLLGLAGGWGLWRSRNFAARRWLLLVSLLIFIRLAFFSSLENPEPRYVVEFFPFLAVLGGIAIANLVPMFILRRLGHDRGGS